jgi:hypothetical protein
VASCCHLPTTAAKQQGNNLAAAVYHVAVTAITALIQ